MSGLRKQRVSLGQGRGPDVELVVTGTQLHATYHTLDGFPAVYDDDLELFCYARLVEGRLESSGVGVTAAPPPGTDREARESDEVRARKISGRASHLDRGSRSPEEEGER